MKIKIVYFAYLIPDKWYSIIDEQMNSLKNCGLYDDAIDIIISVVSDDNELPKLKKLLQEKYDKIIIKNIFKDNVYEYPGLKTIYQIAEDEDDIILLYFHSKGITSNQHETRRYLFKHTIENYKEIINEFIKNKNLDIACAIPHINGFAYFNFFWARSSYIRNYCSKPEISTNRYIWEVWVGNEFSRKKKIITYSPIIKYDQVTSTDEVWNIHNKMVNNDYDKQVNNNDNEIETLNITFDENNKIIVTKLINEKIISEPINNNEYSYFTNIQKCENIKQPIKPINPIKPIKPIIKTTDNTTNPYDIFERYKNKNKYVLDLGSDIGHMSYILSKRFKKVIALENNLNNLKIFESNIKKFNLKNIIICNKKLVNIKTNIQNNITIKELIYNYIYKYNDCNIGFINCNLKGDEEEIIEDLFYFAFINKCKIFIKFNTIKWKNKDISRYQYLFDYFIFNKNKFINNINTFILFEPNHLLDLQLIKKNMTIFIISYNQYTYINNMVKQLENYTNDIVIVDNNSTYKPLLNYFNTKYKYSLLTNLKTYYKSDFS